MQVDISHISKAESGPEALYAITFTLLSGKRLILIQELSINFVTILRGGEEARIL